MIRSSSYVSVCLLLLSACASTAKNEAPQPQAGGNAAAYDSGVALRTEPFTGTRYLTAVGLPNAAVTLPDWVVNPTLDGVLGSIGVASRNDLGTSHQIDNARLSARLEIARMLEVRVQEIGRRDLEQHLTVDGNSGIMDEGSHKSNLGVDRAIADMVLAGSRQRAMWFDPASGDCYVWMVMDGNVKTRADHYVENGVSVYVANQMIANEFRPERPKLAQPSPAPVVEVPEPPKGPIEQLESNLKPIESIPVKGKDDAKGGN